MNFGYGSRTEVKRTIVDDVYVYDPPLDEGWDELTRLHWRAGLLHFDTALEVGARVDDRGGFAIGITGGGLLHCPTFRDAWMFMAGIGAGHAAAKRQ